MQRVVVTGMGAVSACGLGADALWLAARDGISGRKPVHFPEIDTQRVGHAAALSDADKAHVAAIAGHRMRDPVAGYALIAAREAVAQAGLGPDDFGDACGVSIGSGFGGAQTLNSNYLKFATQGSMRLDPMSVPKIMNNAAASWVSIEFGATGPAYCMATACSSASQSIGLAVQMLRAGAASRMLAGGSEACLEGGVFRVWELLRVMTADLNRPFSQDRNGMMLGEVLCEIKGYGTNSDAGDLLRPDPDRAAACMGLALRDAGLTAGDIAHVNTHGTGTVANDVTEAAALRLCFGDAVPPVTATKPVHGHALGAAGALELIVSIGALRARLAPPTLNFSEADPKVGLTPVHGQAMALGAGAVMSNSLAFGGINASLIVADV